MAEDCDLCDTRWGRIPKASTRTIGRDEWHVCEKHKDDVVVCSKCGACIVREAAEWDGDKPMCPVDCDPYIADDVDEPAYDNCLICGGMGFTGGDGFSDDSEDCFTCGGTGLVMVK